MSAPRRFATCIALGAVLGVGGALLFAAVNRAPADSVPPAGVRTAWTEWQALPEQQRLFYVRLYQRLAARPGFDELLDRAVEFARLPETEQQALTRTNTLLQDTLRGLPAPRRQALLALEPEARALEIYRLLQRSTASQATDGGSG